MKIDFNSKSIVSSTVVEDDNIKMRFDENSTPILFDIFLDKMYSNPIGSIVREIVSNAHDSHVEANVVAPIIIRKTMDYDKHYISFIDSGVGMSPDRVKTIYTVLLKSSKNDDNAQIGGWGLGAKTPLAYKRYLPNCTEYDNSFNIITIHNGVKYYYVVHSGNEIPEVTLLLQEKTTEHNGTEVKIEVLENDMDKFINEFYSQLPYFENIIFEGFDSYPKASALNNFKIYEKNTYLYRDGEYRLDNKMHLCVGRVKYPINFSFLDVNSSYTNVDIGIKVNIGDVDIPPTRENIQYTEKSISFLNKRIKEAIGEIQTQLQENGNKVVGIIDYFNYMGERCYVKLDDNVYINLGYSGNEYASNVKLLNYKYHKLRTLNTNDFFYQLFNVKHYGSNKTVRGRLDKQKILSHKNILEYNNIYLAGSDFKYDVTKQRYLHSIHDRFYIISPKYVNLDHMYKLPRGEEPDNKTREIGKQMVNEYLEYINGLIPLYNDVVVPNDFKEKNKINRSKINILDVTIPAELKNSQGSKYRIKMSELLAFNGAIFYGFTEDSYTLKAARDLVNDLFGDICATSGGTNSKFYKGYSSKPMNNPQNKNMVLIIEIAKSNEKYMKHLKRAKHIDEIYNSLLYRKLDTIHYSLKYDEILYKFNTINRLFTSPEMELVNEEYGKKIKYVLEKINEIKTKHVYSVVYYHNTKLLNHIKVDTKIENRLTKEMDYIIELSEKHSKLLDFLIISGWNIRRSEYAAEVLKRVIKFV